MPLKKPDIKIPALILRVPLKYFLLSTVCVWTAVVLILLFWSIVTEKKGTIQGVTIEARTLIKKDKIYRKWNNLHGGVYVPVTKETLPNKYLSNKERDVVTPFGVKLTKINPAYMTRQVNELEDKIFGVKGSITSLKPIHPDNAPDPWEKKALLLFNQEKKEISSVETINNELFFRLIQPLVTEKSCLQCHFTKGAKVGDVRGGLSVSIPISEHLKIEKEQIEILSITFGLLWLIGVLGISFSFFLLKQKIESEYKSEINLSNQEKMQGVLEMAGAVCHELNQPLQESLTASEIIQINIKEEKPVGEELTFLIDGLEKMGEITDKLMQVTKYKTKKYLKGEIIDLDRASDFNNRKLRGKSNEKNSNC